MPAAVTHTHCSASAIPLVHRLICVLCVSWLGLPAAGRYGSSTALRNSSCTAACPAGRYGTVPFLASDSALNAILKACV
jgi:hypothetical protein